MALYLNRSAFQGSSCKRYQIQKALVICIRLLLEGVSPDDEEKIWHFDDAPRDMRIRGAKFLSKFIAQLNEDAQKKAAEITKHADQAGKLAASINAIAQASKGRTTLIPKAGK